MGEVSAVLRQMRLAAGLTQEALAEYLSVDQSYISTVERGARPPSWRYLVNFANILKVNIITLLRAAGLIHPDTVALEQEIAALIEEYPPFLEIFQAARELTNDPNELQQLADFAQFALQRRNQRLGE